MVLLILLSSDLSCPSQSLSVVVVDKCLFFPSPCSCTFDDSKLLNKNQFLVSDKDCFVFLLSSSMGNAHLLSFDHLFV